MKLWEIVMELEDTWDKSWLERRSSNTTQREQFHDSN